MAALSLDHGTTALRLGGVAGAILGLGTAGGGGTVPSTPASASTLGQFASAVDWWDATTPAGCYGPSGSSLAQWAGASVSGVSSLVAGGSPLAAWDVSANNGAGGATASSGWGRLNGTLGGVATLIDPGPNHNGYIIAPCLGQANVWRRPVPLALPASADWCLAVAWGKPNIKQGNYYGLKPQSDTHVLLQLGTTPIAWLDNAYRSTFAGPDIGGLYVFGTEVASTMAPRHRGTLLLVNTANQGVSVYLNGQAAPVATNIACPLTTAAGTLLVGGSLDQYWGGAQVYIYESMIGGTLSAAELAGRLAALGRHATGAWPALMISRAGQSDEGYFDGDGAGRLMCKLIQYYGGFSAVNFVDDTVAPGKSLYDPSGSSYLTDAGVGTDPSTWMAGTTGQTELAAIGALMPVWLADVACQWSFYGEAEGLLPSNLRTTYAAGLPTSIAAQKRWHQLVRAARPGGSATTIPVGAVWAMQGGDSLPPGVQMVRDKWSVLAADASQGVTIVLANTSDATGRTGTGIIPGPYDGSSAHINAADYMTFATRAAPAMARMLSAAGIAPMPMPAVGTAGGVPVLGPSIRRAQWVTDASGATVSSTPTRFVLVTIQHDTGTALLANAVALTGLGWSVRYGWTSPDARGTAVLATALAVTGAATAVLTLASAPGAGTCLLFYCETPVSGGAAPGGVGAGNALYDNTATLPQPSGFNVVADLGSGLVTNYPVAALLGGIAFT